MNKLELLSPAKDLECGIAAINCGADALYIGAPKFGARAAVGNSIDDIAKLINFAHKFWVKVYVTVNTIIYEDELEEVQQLIHQLYEIGTDAIIIQDMGILGMDLPLVPIFASTQTHNYSVDKIKFLEQTGIQRIILARELSLEQIKEIRKHTTIDLEFFIHGALCVCFSGQCYFSQATTGRSANRGECSQPCRMLYSLEDAEGNVIVKDKYLLSLKDLNLSSYLAELIDAGISSFKIEGRLKDISYVKNVTAFYRQKLDALIANDKSLAKSSSGKVYIDFKPDPDKTFNRGYTDYFIEGRKKEIASPDTQKSIGKYLGKVKRIEKDFFEVSTKEILINDDGICYFDSKNILRGMIISKVNNNRIFTDELSDLKIGTKIYRNRDHQFIKDLSKETSTRKIQAKLVLNEAKEGMFISADDEDGNQVSVLCEFVKEPANNPEQMYKTIGKQMLKSGDSIFEVKDVQINLRQTYFLPVAKLNEFRREALNQLEAERIKNFPRQSSQIIKSNHKYPGDKLDYHGNVVNLKAEKFYADHGVEVVEEGFEKLSSVKGKIIMTTKYCIKDQLGICPQNRCSQLKVKEPLFLADGKRKYQLIFNCKNCEMSIKL